MKLTDLSSGVTVTLPTNMVWADEMDWLVATAKVDRSLTGALIVQAAAKQLGREITLEPADDEMSWIQRTDLLKLKSWADVPDRRLELVIEYTDQPDRRFVVRFRTEDKAVESVPVYRWQAPDQLQWYRVTLRLMEIE